MRKKGALKLTKQEFMDLILDGGDATLPPRCPPLQDPSNAVSTMFVDRYGAVAIVTCAVGYAFKEGGTSRTSLCIAGRWTDINGCQGNFSTQ